MVNEKRASSMVLLWYFCKRVVSMSSYHMFIPAGDMCVMNVDLLSFVAHTYGIKLSSLSVVFVWFACYRSPLKEMVISSHSLLYMYVWASNIGLLAVCMELFLYNITLKLQNKTNMELYTVVFLLSCSYVIYNTSCMNYSFAIEAYILLFKKSMEYDANKLVLVIRSQMPSFMSRWVQILESL